MAPVLLNYVTAYYANYSQRWLGGEAVIELVQMSDVALKIAQNLVCRGYEVPAKDELCRQFFQLLASQVSPMWSIICNLIQSETSEDLAEVVLKHLRHAGRFCMDSSDASLRISD